MENLNELRKSLQKRNFYTLKDSCNTFLFALVSPLLLGIIIVFFANLIVPEDFTNELWWKIVGCLLTPIVFVGLYFSLNKIVRVENSACNLSFKKASVWTSLLSCLLGCVCVLGFLFLIYGCFDALWETIGIKSAPAILPLNSVGWFFVNILLLGIIPAITEELIFRGVIFTGFKQKLPAWASVLLTGLLFALMHQNVQQFLYPFILGSVLSLVMHRTNNLLYPILIHLFNNITTITLSFLQEMKIIDMSFFNPTVWWWVLVAIALALICGLLIFLFDRFYLRKRKPVEIEKQGELIQSPPICFKKIPISLIAGIFIAIVLIVINACAV